MKSHHAAILVAACVLGVAGCWHKESQQQQFLEALNRGNGAQAGEIWRNMDADSRAALAHNEGIKPKLSPAQVQQQVMKHYGGDSQSDSDETIEHVTPNIGSGGIESLPEYIGPSGGGAPTVTVPPITTPSN
ncbi:MAG: hypothetical protein Q7S58_03760 [Candidatus Binatus sp.]|nr:hypothetical protein [Candidatus Binatus sp.]